jgi:hypothetical protein
LAAGGLVALGLLLAVVSLALFLGGPSEGGAGERWSHKELLAHLEQHGIRGQTAISHRPGPSMYLFCEPLDDLNYYRDLFDGRAGGPYPVNKWGATVWIGKEATAGDARDKAGTLGEHAWSWGRFLFVGDPQILARIRRALP